MTWTTKQRLEALMRLPWTILTEKSEFGDYSVWRIAEMPDAIVTGTEERELARETYLALKASLACRLEFGDEITLPPGTQLPWANGAEPPVTLRPAKIDGAGDAWQLENSGTSGRMDAKLAVA